MKPLHRWSILATLLVATLAAGAWMEEDRPDAPPAVRESAGTLSSREPAATRAAPANVAHAAESAQLHIEKFGARQLGDPTRDPFAVAEVAADGRKPRSARKAPPTIPSVPFAYMGLQRDDAGEAVFLAFADRNVVVREGDTVDALYRIEQVDDEAITVTYLPLALRQTVPLGQVQ